MQAIAVIASGAKQSPSRCSPRWRLPRRFAPRNDRVARCGVLLASVFLTGCTPAVLDPLGPVGAGRTTILINSLAIMLAIVVPTIVATLGCAWWYRSSNIRARYLPDWAYSGQLELIVWAIPLLTIMLLGGVAWIGSHDLDPAKPLPSKDAPLDVQVVSLDWKWLFIYPDQQRRQREPPGHSRRRAGPLRADIGERDERLLRPAARQHDLHDERHDDAAQSARRRARHLRTACRATTAATASPTCISTWRHCRRTASPPGSRRRASNGPTLTAQSYADLAKQSVNVAPFTYRDVDPDLFQKIVTAGAAARPGADRRNQSGRIQAGGEVACWAS